MGGPRLANYRELIAWQRAMDFVDMVYRRTAEWPAAERYGLTSQVRRAVVSVPANISEGHGRMGPREFVHHLSIAHGSRCETETLLQVASRQQLLSESALTEMLACSAEVGRLINGLMRSLNKTAASSDP